MGLRKGIANRLGLRQRGGGDAAQGVDPGADFGSNAQANAGLDAAGPETDSPLLDQVAADQPERRGGIGGFFRGIGARLGRRRAPNAAGPVAEPLQPGPGVLTDADVLPPEEVEGEAEEQADSMNTVGKMRFGRGIGGSEVTEGFTKGKAGILNDAAARARIGAGGYAGKDPANGSEALGESDRYALATRSVASSALDQELGTGVIASSAHTRVGGEDGYVSGKAAGREVVKNRGVAHGERQFHANEVDFSNPVTQRGMADLQVNDWISGQVDRHAGNAFVDPASGQVTGIDNDLAFGAQNKAVTSGPRRGQLLPEGYGVNMGVPAQIDRQTAARVTALDPERLATILRESGRPDSAGESLSDAEIAAAQVRLAMLKDKIAALSVVNAETGRDGLIDEWNDETLQAATGPDAPESVMKFMHAENTRIKAGQEELAARDAQVAAPEGAGPEVAEGEDDGLLLLAEAAEEPSPEAIGAALAEDVVEGEGEAEVEEAPHEALAVT